jgi:DNA-binding response OmpR family regulator
MADVGRVLIAARDDEFAQAATDVLQEHGYRCDWVRNGVDARKALGVGSYALVITEPDLAGEGELGLVRWLCDGAPGVQAVLVAPQFEARTAIECLELPVAACLETPVDPDRLLGCVEAAVRRASTCRAVHCLRERLGQWLYQLAPIERTLEEGRAADAAVTIDVFLDLTFQNIVGALSDVRRLTESLAGSGGEADPCHLLGCPRVEHLTETLLETVRVLEETKGAFKSKRLGQLRRKIAERLRLSDVSAAPNAHSDAQLAR